jgi:hypothetical protein
VAALGNTQHWPPIIFLPFVITYKPASISQERAQLTSEHSLQRAHLPSERILPERAHLTSEHGLQQAQLANEGTASNTKGAVGRKADGLTG